MSQRIVDRSYVGEILQRIYNSRLNIQLSIFSEGGYFYMEYNNKKNPLPGTTVEEAITHLALTVSQEFPKSPFAEWWKTTFREETTNQ